MKNLTEEKNNNDRIIPQFENKHTLIASVILIPLLAYIIHIVSVNLHISNFESNFGNIILGILIIFFYGLTLSIIIKFYKPVAKQNYITNLTFSIQIFFAALLMGALLSIISALLKIQLFNNFTSYFVLILFTALYWLFVLYPYAKRKWGFSVPKFYLFMIISVFLSFILLGVAIYIIYLILIWGFIFP